MIGMIETGIPKLDKLLEGSIKKWSNILLIGPPMSGKELPAGSRLPEASGYIFRRA
jgi:KaiC/GvpD/RAD55 family RecA-like ATPase